MNQTKNQTLTDSQIDKFSRTIQLLGKEAIETLWHSRVIVCGLGGVGSYVVENLARAGVGNFLLIDSDIFKPSNFNRQLYALDSTANMSKADAAAARIKDINPDCCVDARQQFVDRAVLEGLLLEESDIIVDAIDSLAPKVELLAWAVLNKRTIISSMGAAARFDPTAVKIDDIFATTICPLARYIRKRLHRRGIFSGIPCVYSTEVPISNKVAVVAEDFGRGRVRIPLGSISFMPGIFGLFLAHLAIKKILE